MTIDARPSQTQPLQAARAPGPALDVAWLLNVAWNRRRGIVATVAACMLAALLFGLFASFPEEQPAARAEAARPAFTSLNARLDELRERVQQAEQRVEDYKKANNVASSGGTLLNERPLTEINSQLVLAQSRSAEAKARYDKIREAQCNRADPGAIGEGASSATITTLRTQLAEIARKQDEINATLGKRHPAVIEIESQARRIRGMIAEEVARIAEAARNDMERALANEAMLAANLGRLKSELEGAKDAGVKLRELEHDVQVSRSVYEAFLALTREVSERERLDTTNIRAIATPDLPENRSFPPRTLVLLAAGGMLGGLLGVALAFFGAWRDRRTSAVVVAALEPATPDPATPGPVTARPADPFVAAAPAAAPAPFVPAPPVAPPPSVAATPVVASPPHQPAAAPVPPSERARQFLERTGAQTSSPPAGKKPAFRL